MTRLDGLRVLVVDNEEDTLSLVSEVLRMHGADVWAAPSAQAALARLEHELPDVIVSDIGMPVEDGYSLIRKVRALPVPHGREVPAIALTAYAAATDAEEALAAGFQLHVPKPIDPFELVAVVARLGRPASVAP